VKLERRKQGHIIVPIASIGDIAFLLIIFFILASNFVREKNVRQELPTAREIEIMESLPVSVAMDEDGVVFVNGEECQVDALESLAAAMLRDLPEKRVMLKVDRELPEETFRPVLMALSKAGAEIALVGMKEN
jgi:biopolymer transport protein ExbD